MKEQKFDVSKAFPIDRRVKCIWIFPKKPVEHNDDL